MRWAEERCDGRFQARDLAGVTPAVFAEVSASLGEGAG